MSAWRLLLAFVAAVALMPAAEARAADDTFVLVPRGDSPGNDYLKLDHSSLGACESRCGAENACNAFTYNQLHGTCLLKLSASAVIGFYALATTGVKRAPSLRPAGNAPGVGSAFVMLSQADSPGNDYARLGDASFEECQGKCERDEGCHAFTYNHTRGACFLKREANRSTSFHAWTTTGIKLLSMPKAATESEGAARP
jgi:hypothetical protein